MDDKRPAKKSSRTGLKTFDHPAGRLTFLRLRGHDVGGLPGFQRAEDASMRLTENAVTSFPVPIGIAENFIINDAERLVTMATEERSVVAAASYAAKLCRETGGFRTTVSDNVTRGQVFYGPSSFENARMSARDAAAAINKRSRELIAQLIAADDPMTKHGGGAYDISACRHAQRGDALVVSLTVNVADAMGASVVTRMGETLAVILEPLLGIRPTTVICSNEAQGSTVRVTAEWPTAPFGERLLTRIIELQSWADEDKRRAVTHNKGIMNGVSAVCLATGQDVRAVEAAAHAAATDELLRYRPFTAWHWLHGDRTIRGMLKLCVPLGTVGGATSHPTAAWCRKLMGVENVSDLAAIVGAVGLAQNFAALRSLADEGITEARRRACEK